jgi:acyl-CoA thioesterase FadM
MRDYSAGHIGTDAARDIVAGLSRTCAGIDMAVYPGVQYRHILVLKAGAGKPGAPSFEAGMEVRPPHDITGQGIAPDMALFRRSPILWDFMTKANAYLAAANHGTRANAVWPWGQGGTLTLPSFEEKRGMRGAVISAVDLVKGLGRAAAMEVIDVPGATGLLDTNYAGKVEAALSFLSRGDFVFVHVEAPDECGQAGRRPKRSRPWPASTVWSSAPAPGPGRDRRGLPGGLRPFHPDQGQDPHHRSRALRALAAGYRPPVRLGLHRGDGRVHGPCGGAWPRSAGIRPEAGRRPHMILKRDAFPLPDAWYRFRVSYGETDMMGVAYYGEYPHWFERARSQFIRDRGMGYGDVEKRGIILPVARDAPALHQIRPLRRGYPGPLRRARMGRASMLFTYQVFGPPDGETLLAVGQTQHACVNPQGRPVAVPDWLKALFQTA